MKSAIPKFPKHLLLVLFLLLVSHIPLSAGEPLSLEDCLRLGLQHNRMLQISHLSVQQAIEKIRESGSQMLPSLSLNATYTRLGKVTSFDIPMGPVTRTFRFGVPNRVMVDARAQWSVFTWGRIRSNLQISRVGHGLSVTERKREISATLYQLLQAYYSVLLNERVVALQDENYQRAQEFYRISQGRFSAGGLSHLELLRAEVQVKTTHSNRDEARGNLLKSKMLLAKLVGAGETDISVAGSLRYVPVTPDIPEITEQALTARSDYIAIQLQQEINRQQIRLAGSTNKPNLSLFTGYNVQNGFDPTDPERFVDVWNAGVQLSFPLFDGFATSHRVQQARIEGQKTRIQQEELSELISLQIRQAVTTLQQAAVRIEAQQENIRLSRQALQVATDQYQQGLASSLDVLVAQQTLAQNEMVFTQALFNHLMAKIEISRAREDFGWFTPELSRVEVPEP